jgi:hypothetical protein
MAQKKEKAGVDSKPAKAKESRIVTLKVPASAKTIVNQWQQSAPAGAVPAALGGQHVS